MYKFFLPVNYFVVPAGSIVLNNCLKSHRLEWKAGILHFECVCVIPAFVLINIIVCFFLFSLACNICPISQYKLSGFFSLGLYLFVFSSRFNP